MISDIANGKQIDTVATDFILNATTGALGDMGFYMLDDLAKTYLPQEGSALYNRWVSSGRAANALDNQVAQYLEDGLKRELESASADINKLFYKYGDTLRESLGPARESHPEEYAAILNDVKSKGKNVILREGTLCYDGEQIIIDPDASIGALRHEYRHVLDDYASGNQGLRLFADPDVCWLIEYRGYMEEYNLALRMNDEKSMKFIIDEMEERYKEIYAIAEEERISPYELLHLNLPDKYKDFFEELK